MDATHSPGYQSAPTSRNRTVSAIGLIVAIAGLSLGIRLYRIDAESLWMDEVRQVSYYGLPLKYVVLEAAGQAQPPLDYLIGAGLDRLGLADSDWWVRLPAALFGAGGVLMLGLLVRRIGGGVAGVSSAALLAVCPLHVAMSQEARPYTIFFFFAMATVFAYVWAREQSSSRRWVVFAALLLCTLMTRWVGPHVVAMCLGAYAVWQRFIGVRHAVEAERRAESSRFVATLVAMLGAYAVYNPIFGLIYALDKGFAASRVGAPWGTRVGAMLNNTLEAIVGADAGLLGASVSGSVLAWGAIIGLFVGAMLLVRACLRREGGRYVPFAVVVLAFPFLYAAIYARFTWFPAKPQYLLIGAATFCTTAALVVRWGAGMFARWRVVSIAAGVMLFCVFAVPMATATWQEIRDVEKPDWRGALKYLREHADPDDAFASLRPGGIRKGAGSDIIGADRYLRMELPWLHVGIDTHGEVLDRSPWTRTDSTLWVLCNAAPHGAELLKPPFEARGVRVYTFHRLFLLEVSSGKTTGERLIDAIAAVDEVAPTGAGLVGPNLLRAEVLAARGESAGAEDAISSARRQCRTADDTAVVAAFSVPAGSVVTFDDTRD